MVHLEVVLSERKRFGKEMNFGYVIGIMKSKKQKYLLYIDLLNFYRQNWFQEDFLKISLLAHKQKTRSRRR